VRINGVPLEVEPGTTVLEAARRLGVEIPTLCRGDGVEPAASCFLCVVEIEGRSELIPSCVAPVSDGMVVTTDSERVREARRTALELLLSDHKGDCRAPCSLACPARPDLPGFIREIAEGRPARAAEIIRDRIALPASLGRICPKYCERVCRRRKKDEPIAVCALERFAADADIAAGCRLPPVPEQTGKRVAIVGAGPAGLSAAFYLLARGHGCTVFDANERPGGMFRYGIPEFRLPNSVVDVEADIISRMGARFEMNTRVGSDVSLDGLRRDFDAVFVAVGAQAEPSLACDGAQSARSGLAFLRSAGQGLDGGARVVIIGGGFEAVACARSAVRRGADIVTVVCDKGLSPLKHMRELLEAARAEGVRFIFSARPVRISARRGEEHEVSFEATDGTFAVAASVIVHAPERKVDAESVAALGLEMNQNGIAADATTHETSLDGVFAGGDAVSGPSVGVRAVVAGRKAAHAIHQYLCSGKVTGESRPFNMLMGKLSDEERAAFLSGVDARPRARARLIEAARRRKDFGEVDRGLDEPEAVREARRCLQCDCLGLNDCKLRAFAAEYGARARGFSGECREYHRDDSHPEIVYESHKCILCGLCVRIARRSDENFALCFANRGFRTRVKVPLGRLLCDISDEVLARCARACPTGALAFKRPADYARRRRNE